MDPKGEIARLLNGQAAQSMPLDILPPIARQPSWPSGSSPDLIKMANEMFRSGAINKQQFEQMMTDPRQFSSPDIPQTGKIY